MEKLEKFREIFEKYHRDDREAIKLILENNKLMDYLNTEGFFTAPASTKYHGAYEGGLFDHSCNVCTVLEDLTNKLQLQWKRNVSPFIVGMFHDLCKCDQYNLVKDNPEIVYQGENGNVICTPANYHYEYNTNTLLKGHGAKSVMILSQFIHLTEEELLCIRYHMGPYEKEEWAEYDAAIRKYGTVLFTHTADMVASKLIEK